ncbi:unnamed protein product [Sphenostylis stenocarpa]|uniref:Uncharacterized protein n=1 Tax=Sphenostylis stenocarpa TaxID=92480 RepID=A0AA86W1B1_9FABA|nr:unnamed protein product [Sphenostylis stenocarpa]
MERFPLPLSLILWPHKPTFSLLLSKTKLQLPFFSFGFLQPYPKTLHSYFNNLQTSFPVHGQTKRVEIFKFLHGTGAGSFSGPYLYRK